MSASVVEGKNRRHQLSPIARAGGSAGARASDCVREARSSNATATTYALIQTSKSILEGENISK
jgi:hypothetical protein